MSIKPNIVVLTQADKEKINHVYYGVHQSSLGLCLVTLCEKGVLSVGFYTHETDIPEWLI